MAPINSSSSFLISFAQMFMHLIMTKELIIREIRIDRPRHFRFMDDEFRGHYAA